MNANDRLVQGALTALNVALGVAHASEKYRAVVAQAVAQGRDVSDAELEQASADAEAALDAAAAAKPQGE